MEEEPDEVEDNEISELQRVRWRNIRLDQEILALNNRIRTLDVSLSPGYQEQAVAELREVHQTLLDASEACSSLTSECDLSDQKTEELDLDLELELLQQSQAMQEQNNLQEKLFQEEARVAEAEGKIAELCQKLTDSQHQMQPCETHILERKRLEEEAKELREKEAKAQRQFQEEQWKRKLLDRQTEELHRQLRLQREKEAQLVRTCAELQVQGQQQEARLRVLEEEKKTLSNEHVRCQTHSQKLLEQIVALQQEKEALFKEVVRIFERMDVSLRRHHERKLRHKAQLRRAKEIFVSQLKRRDACIRHLANKLRLSKGQAEKVSAANGEFLQERTKLLEQLHGLREAERSNKQVLSAIQSRVQFLDEENKQHQERSLQLATQVGDLKRTLRKIHGQDSGELKSVGFPEWQLQSKILPRPTPKARFSVTDLSESSGPPEAAQGAEGAGFSPMPFQPPEIGSLNVASPGDLAGFHKGRPSGIFSSNQM